jgi:chemotaxis protein MotD
VKHIHAIAVAPQPATVSKSNRPRPITGGFAQQLAVATSSTTGVQPAAPVTRTAPAKLAPSKSAPSESADSDVIAATNNAAVMTANAAATTTTSPAGTAASSNVATSLATNLASRGSARGLVSAVTRANASKQAPASPAQPNQTQPEDETQSTTPVSDALAVLKQPAALIMPAAMATKTASDELTAAPTKASESTAAPAPEATDDAAPTDEARPTPPAAPAADDDLSVDAAPRTPLERAVHDLLSQLDDGGSKHDSSSTDDDAAQAAAQTKLAASAQPMGQISTARPAVAPAPAAPVAQDTPQMQSATHAHIVLGDDASRIVMTVAVRGAAVNVTLKASDDHVAAALARNAGALDDAMRHRGLELDQFQNERDSSPRRESEREDQPTREQPDPDSAEPFQLEEQV